MSSKYISRPFTCDTQSMPQTVMVQLQFGYLFYFPSRDSMKEAKLSYPNLILTNSQY